MEVQCATSFDERFDPRNVLDHSNPGTFWMSTGLYPQEILFQFRKPQAVSTIEFKTSGGKFSESKPILLFHTAKKIVIEGCKQGAPNSFTKIGESKELPNRNAGLQVEQIQISDSTPMQQFKFIITDGWEDFTSVHSVVAQ